MQVNFRRQDNTSEKTIDVLPNSKLGESREVAQMLLGLPENIPYKLLLERNDKELEDNLTFEEAGIQDNDKLILFSPNAQKTKHPQEVTQPPVNPPTSPSLASSKSSSSSNWLMAVMTGSVIGIFIMIAIAISNFNNNLSRLQPTPTPTPQVTPTPEVTKTNATVAGKPGIKNIRSGPGTVYGVVGTISTGSRVKILSQEQDRGGYLWYKIYHPSSRTQGWMAAQLISVD